MKRVVVAAFTFVVSMVAAPAVSAAEVLVYMPLGDAHEVAVVDANKGEVIARIPGVINSHGLAITPDGSTVVAGSLTEQPEDGLPAKPEQISSEEHRAHHSRPDAQRIIQLQSESRGILYLIDVKQRRVRNQIIVSDTVHHNAITPDGKYAISTHPTAGLVSIVDIGQAKVVKTIKTGSVPNYIVTTRDGSRAYVSNSGDNTVSEIDTKNWQTKRQLPAGDAPAHMTLSPGETRLYIINVNLGVVAVLDLNRGKLIGSHAIGAEAHGLAVSDDGRTLFASSKKENKLVKVDLISGEQQTLSLSPAPYHVAMIPGKNVIYVSSRKEAKIWVVDPVTLKVLKQIDLKHGTAHQMVSNGSR